MKKTAWVAGILVLAITITGFGFAISSGACGFGTVYRHGFGRSGMPSLMHEEIIKFMGWRMDNEAKNLNLSETQQKQYDIFQTHFLETMEKAFEARMEFKNKTITALENENPDLSVIASDAKTHIESISGDVSKNLDLFGEFFNSLDPGQRKIIIDHIKERINDHKNNFPCDRRQS